MSIQDESGANRRLFLRPITSRARGGTGYLSKDRAFAQRLAIVSVLLGVAVIGCIWALIALLPLKSFEVVTLVVDKATGFTESPARYRRRPISEREAVTQANIVRYIRAREPTILRRCEIISNWRRCCLAASPAKSCRFVFGRQPEKPRQAVGREGPNQGLR